MRRVRLADFSRRLWRTKTLRILAIVLGSLVLAGLIADRAFDRPLRGIVERNMNEALVGYTAHVGRADFHLIGFALELEDVVVIQNAHPDPPVIGVPNLRMGVYWTDLFSGRLVADATFRKPEIHVNLVQLQEENRDGVPIAERGWQRALESIYPLKINELTIIGGRILYQDEGFEPLRLSDVEIVAHNIRNVRSRERTYPSTFVAEARVFDVGRAVLDGNADFLAEPAPGFQGKMELDLVELKYFQPIAQRLGFTVHGGMVSGLALVEWGPGIRYVDLESVEIVGASVEYAVGSVTPAARTAGQRISEVAKTSLNNPEVLFRAREVLIHDASLQVVNRKAATPFRLNFTHAYVEVTNFSTRAEDGPALLALDGAFMGSGTFEGNATFYPEGEHANLEGKVSIENTPLTTMNDMLRAKGKFDVSRGTFNLYSEFRVRDGWIRGYVKPMFRNVEVLDSEQDKDKNIFRKMYEGIVGGVAKLLRNSKGEVATVATLDGPLENPEANTMQALGGLLRNAFVKSILPGFQDQIKRIEPMKFRAAVKKERKAAKKDK